MMKLYANVRFISFYVPLSVKNKILYNYLQPKTRYETYELLNIIIQLFNLFKLFIKDGEY